VTYVMTVRLTYRTVRHVWVGLAIYGTIEIPD